MNKLLIILLSLFSLTAFSQTKGKKENLIDVQEKKCLDKEDITTAEQCNCTIKAQKDWDKELNKYYSMLKTKLSKEDFEVLKNSQKQWISYRDKEFLFISKYFLEIKQGTMWYPIAQGKKKEIIKLRVAELKNYYEMLEY
ncbi:lysozyme inhibitor LprI family protein [Flavobacterium bizetiae]|uniref:lysozyme inhibitor LprI family protein n=1 Tax=Flavobacterium bizetiae TaxID=2704140 RepID=UPI00375671CF